MLDKFKQCIDEEFENLSNEKLLLAISGGPDSMAMFHLFLKLQFKFAVAHVNYKKRSAASDGDEALVKTQCLQFGIPFHVTEFAGKTSVGGNFQAIARDFRYAYFEALANEFGYSKIATAHHQNDAIETFFINLFRGSGLTGLSSIPMKNDKIIRPLMGFNKEEIYFYLNQNQIPYREDDSNKEDVYLRNFIRNQVLPKIESHSENHMSGILKSIKHIGNSNQLLNDLVLHTTDGQRFFLPYEVIEDIEDKVLFVFLYFKNYGFNYAQIKDLVWSEQLGAKILSASCTLIKDRKGYLLIHNKTNKTNDVVIVYQPGTYDFMGQKLLIKQHFIDENESMPKGFLLYFENSPFPITLRTKSDGDVFKPLGLNGRHQSIKKYYVDHKFSFEMKSQALIVEKENEILALYPYRASDDARKTLKSSIVLTIESILKED